MKLKQEQINELILKAKRDYPIGCRYIRVNKDTIQTNRIDELILDHVTYRYIYSDINMIFASDGGGCLYYDGKWAKLISLINSIDNRFKDIMSYKVTLEDLLE